MNEDLIFKALADDTRRIILSELSEKPSQTLYELCARLTMRHQKNMSRQAITKHIEKLEEAGLVKSETSGKYRILNFNKQPIKHIANKWLK